MGREFGATEVVVQRDEEGRTRVLLPEVLEGRIEPGRVFDRTVSLDEVPEGYRAMDAREALKVLVRP